MRALGIDLGSRRVGVAVSAGTLSTPYEVLVRSGDRRRDHQRIGGFVAETDATVVVVGLPISLDGSIGAAARAVLAEVDQLAASLAVPVETWDERFSTVTAERALAARNVNTRRRRHVVDKVAASVILQAWLDANEEAS